MPTTIANLILFLTAKFYTNVGFEMKIYPPDFLSGKIEVFQTVFPSVTVTGIELQPMRCLAKRDLISVETFGGVVTKYQATGVRKSQVGVGAIGRF